MRKLLVAILFIGSTAALANRNGVMKPVRNGVMKPVSNGVMIGVGNGVMINK